MSEERKSLIVGDVHGHYDRAFKLLNSEGIINDEGVRIDFDTEVIQLGDLGHFGGATGSVTGDKMLYQTAWKDKWFDTILWGNHDRAVAEYAHAFSGFQYPDQETVNVMDALVERGVIKFATTSHGRLLTHAGLAVWPYRQLFKGAQTVEDIARQLNNASSSVKALAIDPISRYRGGRNDYGGILWRDFREKSAKIPQVFGHSKGSIVRSDPNGNLCVDVGDKTNGRLAALKLPEEKVVEINTNDD